MRSTPIQAALFKCWQCHTSKQEICKILRPRTTTLFNTSCQVLIFLILLFNKGFLLDTGLWRPYQDDRGQHYTELIIWTLNASLTDRCTLVKQWPAINLIRARVLALSGATLVLLITKAPCTLARGLHRSFVVNYLIIKLKSTDICKKMILH